MIFPNEIAKELGKISFKIDKAVKISEYEESLVVLKNVLKWPSSIQLIALIEEQRENSKNRRRRLEDVMKADFSILELSLRNDSKNPLVSALLDFAKEEEKKDQNMSMFSKWVILEKAFECVIDDQLGRPNDGMEALVRPNFIKEQSKKIVKTNSVIEWQKEKEEIQSLTGLLRDIFYIKTLKSAFECKDDHRRLKGAMQNICKFFIDAISTENLLRSFEIKSISYLYSHGKTVKQAVLKLSINESRSVLIRGERSSELHKLLQHKWESLELTDDNKKNERLRKDFNEINILIAKKWYSFGFVYGLNNLIVSDGYSHGINLHFARFIK